MEEVKQRKHNKVVVTLSERLKWGGGSERRGEDRERWSSNCAQTESCPRRVLPRAPSHASLILSH